MSASTVTDSHEHPRHVVDDITGVEYPPSNGTLRGKFKVEPYDEFSFIKLDLAKIVLIFTVGSIAGLIVEIIYHFFAFGGYENRFGLVWGPFSPLYGFGAVALTLILNRLWRHPAIVIFLVSLTIGSVLEFATSWAMEYFFGAIAWDYSDTFGNIQGRVNLMFACMWGALGLAWARIAMPLIKRGLDYVEWDSTLCKVASVVLTVFLVVNMIVTVNAFQRESQRVKGMQASTPIDHLLDEHFPTTWMKSHFGNMSIYGSRS